MHRKRIFPALFLLAVLLLTACCAKSETRTVYTMDTVMTLTVSGKNAAAALDRAEAELLRLDALLDRHDGKSALAALNENSAAQDAELAALLTRTKELSVRTNGAFDPTLTPVLDAWGFGTDAPRIPSDTELAELLEAVDAKRITVSGADISLTAGTQVDLGGIAKGYAGERVRAVFAEDGIESAVIDLGGDVCLMGAKPDGSPWRVAVKDPADSAQYIGILSAADTFVVTSGAYERYFEADGVRWHHIIDPATGKSARSGLVSATVVCADGAAADALATAVFVMGADEARAFYEKDGSFELILVTEDGRVLYTDGLAESFVPNTESGYSYEKLS